MLIKSQNLKKKYSSNNLNEANNETEIPNERCISPEKRQQFIDELRWKENDRTAHTGIIFQK